MEDTAAPLLALAGPNVLYARNRRPINCWRCKSTHFKRDCKASQSAEDVQGLPPDQWPIQPSHPDQAPRPSTVPVLYDRPGAPPSHPEARSHVTPIQAFAETVIDRLLALEEGQALITALLQGAFAVFVAACSCGVLGPCSCFDVSVASTVAGSKLDLERRDSGPAGDYVCHFHPARPAADGGRGCGLADVVAESEEYTAIGVSHPDRQGEGQTLWMRKDLLDESLCAVEPATKNDQGAR